MILTDAFYNCYDKSTWSLETYDTLTDTAKNTWCRSPGKLIIKQIFMLNYVMNVNV